MQSLLFRGVHTKEENNIQMPSKLHYSTVWTTMRCYRHVLMQKKNWRSPLVNWPKGPKLTYMRNMWSNFVICAVISCPPGTVQRAVMILTFLVCFLGLSSYVSKF